MFSGNSFPRIDAANAPKHSDFVNGIKKTRRRLYSGCDKSLLSNVTKYQSLAEFKQQELSDGVHDIQHQGFRFPLFLKTNQTSSDKLYVFLRAGRPNFQPGGEPKHVFTRWSWYPLVDGNVVSLDDPMYYKFKDLKFGWYYGTDDVNLIALTTELIRTIAKKLGVKDSKIIIYGSSAGGFAALSIANLIRGSTGVSINGQLNLSEDHRAKHFSQVTNTDLSKPDHLYGRNTLIEKIISDKKSNYLILTNGYSKNDYATHLSKLTQGLKGENPKLGLDIVDGNKYLWTYATHYPNPHNAFDFNIVYSVIQYVLDKIIKKNKFNESDHLLLRMATEFWNRIYHMKIEIETLESAAPKASVVASLIIGVNMVFDVIDESIMSIALQLPELGIFNLII